MTIKDGRDAKQPYRVRAGGVWYWVDPTAPAADIEPGDTVVIYPVAGDAAVAVLQSRFTLDALVTFSTLEGGEFTTAPAEICALHLAVVDEVQ